MSKPAFDPAVHLIQPDEQQQRRHDRPSPKHQPRKATLLPSLRELRQSCEDSDKGGLKQCAVEASFQVLPPSMRAHAGDGDDITVQSEAETVLHRNCRPRSARLTAPMKETNLRLDEVIAEHLFSDENGEGEACHQSDMSIIVGDIQHDSNRRKVTQNNINSSKSQEEEDEAFARSLFQESVAELMNGHQMATTGDTEIDVSSRTADADADTDTDTDAVLARSLFANDVAKAMIARGTSSRFGRDALEEKLIIEETTPFVSDGMTSGQDEADGGSESQREDAVGDISGTARPMHQVGEATDTPRQKDVMEKGIVRGTSSVRRQESREVRLPSKQRQQQQQKQQRREKGGRDTATTARQDAKSISSKSLVRNGGGNPVARDDISEKNTTKSVRVASRRTVVVPDREMVGVPSMTSRPKRHISGGSTGHATSTEPRRSDRGTARPGQSRSPHLGTSMEPLTPDSDVKMQEEQNSDTKKKRGIFGKLRQIGGGTVDSGEKSTGKLIRRVQNPQDSNASQDFHGRQLSSNRRSLCLQAEVDWAHEQRSKRLNVKVDVPSIPPPPPLPLPPSRERRKSRSYSSDGNLSNISESSITGQIVPRRRCAGCRRVETEKVSSFIELGDAKQRCACSICCRTAVVDSVEARRLWGCILRFFERDLGLPVWDEMHDITVVMVSHETMVHQMDNRLEKSAHMGFPHIITQGLCLSAENSGHLVPQSNLVFDRISKSFVDHGAQDFEVPDASKDDPYSSVTGVLCIAGLPREISASILAHEATHAWFRLHPDTDVLKPIPLGVEEGCCQLVSHLFLGALDSAERDSYLGGIARNKQLRQQLKVSIQSDESEIFGQGYRDAANACAEVGIDVLLGHVAMYREIPRNDYNCS